MNKRILIIEDEESIAELQKDYLELHDFHVEIASTGTEGLQKAKESSCDLIILDLMLPHIDGYSLCKQIREDQDIPILMVSAKKEEVDKIKGFGLGADDYIVKPFSPSELVARVKAHLSRYDRLVSKVEEKDVIRFGEIKIDLPSRRLYVLGEEVILTTREFDLLVFLVKNPNHVFSKEHLFEKIWGMESMGDITTVTVHIRKIREKIEKDPSNPIYIETVWGAGYRFTMDI